MESHSRVVAREKRSIQRRRGGQSRLPQL